MSKQKLTEARDLMTAERYDEARAILEKLNDPKAKQWLEQINKLESKRSSGKGPGILSRLFGYLLTIIVSAVITSLLIAGLVLATAPLRQSDASVTRVSLAGQLTTEPATAGPTSTPARTAIVSSASDAVNVRSAPGTTSNVVGSAQPGTQVIVLGQNQDGTWQNIQLEDGTEGWVSTSLLRLAVLPTSTPEAEATAEADSAEAATVVECEGTEAQDWWSDHASTIFNRASLVRLQAEDNQMSNIVQLYGDLQSDQELFEEADYPACVGPLRENILTGVVEILGGMQDYANGNQNGGISRMMNTQTAYFDPVMQTVTGELGVQVFSGECPVDVWMLAIDEEYEIFSTTLNDFNAGAVTPETVRPLIFETQRLRQAVNDGYSPECAAPAKTALLQTMDTAVALFQAVFAGDQSAVQQNQTEVNAAREAFRTEMTRMGYPIR